MTTDTLDTFTTGAPAATSERQPDAGLDGIYCRLTQAPDPEAGTPARYRWHLRREGHWLAGGEDDLDTIVAQADDPLARWILVLPGEQVITRRLTLSEAERRYYKKLAPFQLEEDIIDEVEDLHFVYGELGEDWVNLAYTRRAPVEQALVAFHERELAVAHIVSEADLLPGCEPGEWLLWSDGEHCYLRTGQEQFSAVRLALAPALLASLQAQRPESVQLLAADEPALAQLRTLLPASLTDKVHGARVLAAPLALPARHTNLAVAPYYPRLPLARWYQRIRLPLAAAAAAVLLHLGLTLSEWYLIERQTDNLRQAITERYRAAVPSGAISDPLKQLRNQVARLGNQGSGSNALFMLSQTIPVLVAQAGLEVKNLQFLNDAQELRLTLQAPALADIESLSGQLKARGFGAEVLSVNVNQGVHQARMKVTR